MRRFLRDNGLSITLIAFFLVFLGGQFVTGYRVENQDRLAHGEAELSVGSYASSGHFIEATFENWESEFLQMGFYVLATALLFQRGSAESRDPDNPDGEPAEVMANAPWPVKRGGLVLKLYENSLAIAFLAFFLAAFFLHLWGGSRAFSAEQIAHGEPAVSTIEFLGTSQFWFESFQNWQSEFLAVAALVLLSIVLRQKNSPESKPVEAPHSETGG